MTDVKMTIYGLMHLRPKVHFILRVVTIKRIVITRSQKKFRMSIMKTLKRMLKRWLI